MTEIADLTAIRDGLAAAKRARAAAMPQRADPLLVLEDCVNKTVTIAAGLAESVAASLAATEQNSAAHAAQIAALTTAVQMLTRTTMSAVGSLTETMQEVLRRLPPAPS